jgi:hypothetical protein
MIYNAPNVKETAQMGSDRWKAWVGSAIGGFLIVAGIIGLVWPSIAGHFGWVCCPSDAFVDLWKAMFIAGVVTVAVDPFLKRRLLKEASTDIFHHLLGFDLPKEIRESLRDFLLNNRSYRENVIIDVHAQTASDGLVDVTWLMRWDVVAVATTEYQQHVSFEEADQGQILEASVTWTSHPKLSYTKKTPTLTPEENEPMVSAWSGKKIKLKNGDVLHAYVKFVTRGPLTGYSVTNFAYSTINPRVKVSSSDDLEIYASQSDQRVGNEYIYRKVFVPSDHIQIRWRPKTTT